MNEIIRGLSLLFHSLPQDNSMSSSNWSLLGNGIFSLVLPFTISFIAFSLLVSTWISLYHFVMKNQATAATTLRKPLYILNIIILLVNLAMVILLSQFNNSTDTQLTIVESGTAIMGILTITLSLSFSVYGTLLSKQLSHKSLMKHTSSN